MSAAAKRRSSSPPNGAIGARCCAAIVWLSVYFVMPSAPCRLPRPDWPIPPMGAPDAPQDAAYPSLMLTVPVRIRRARARAVRTSRLQIEALSPYAVSLASAIASSSEPTR